MRSQSNGTDKSTLYSVYREVPQDSTHFAPFELMYDRTLRGPIHILRELWIQDIDELEVKSSYQYVLDLQERLNDTLKLAKEQLESSQARQKKHFDKKTKTRRFSPDDKVLVLLPTDANKLLVQCSGKDPMILSTQWILMITRSRSMEKRRLCMQIFSRNIFQEMKKLVQEYPRS